jgi:VanZ family protein
MSHPPRSDHEWRHKAFVWYVAIMIVVFLLPVPNTPLAEAKHVDKLVHFGIFLGFALLSSIDREWEVWWTLVISVVFAGAIELVQWKLPYREGDWRDFGAGALGAGVGAVFVLLGQRRVNDQ